MPALEVGDERFDQDLARLLRLLDADIAPGERPRFVKLLTLPEYRPDSLDGTTVGDELAEPKLDPVPWEGVDSLRLLENTALDCATPPSDKK